MPPRRLPARLSPRAEEDRDALFDYGIKEWGADQALAYILELLEAVERLADFPELGKRRDDLAEGMRRLRVEEHVAYYVIEPAQIRISRIPHVRQDPTAAIGL